MATRATNLEIISMDDEYYISVDRIMTKITTQAKFVFLDEEMYIMFLARSEMFNEDIGYCYCFDSMKDYQVIKNIIKQINTKIIKKNINNPMNTKIIKKSFTKNIITSFVLTMANY